MTVLSGGLFLIEVEPIATPNVWVECSDLTRVTKSNNVTITRTRVFRKTYRAASTTDHVYTLAGLLNYTDPGQAALFEAERLNVPIRVRWTENEDNAAMKMATVRIATITHDATPAPGEIQTVSFELRSAVAPTDFSITPTTPAGLFSTFNQLGVAQMQKLYVKGVNQTIAAGKCTRWGDAIANTNATAFVPSPEVPAGADVDGTGAIISDGLELPAAANLSGGAALADPTATTDAPLAGSGGLVNIGSRNDVGIQWGLFGKMRRNTSTLAIGEAGASNYVEVSITDPTNQVAVRYDASLAFAGENAHSADGTGGTKVVHQAVWAAQTTGGFLGNQPLIRLMYHRDIVMDKFYDIGANPAAAGRRVRIFNSTGAGWPANGDNATHLFYITYGRPNAAQIKLLNDYVEQWLGAANVLADERPDLYYEYGDSWGPGALAIQMGENGSPRLASVGVVSFARGGNTVQAWQFPMTYYLRDCDFSRRTGRVVVSFAEYLNGGTPTQVGFVLQLVKTYSSKIHTVTANITHSQGDGTTSNSVNDPAYQNAINANWQSVWGADALIDFYTRTLLWDPYHYGTGAPSYPPGQKAILWDGSSNHPSSLAQEVFTPFWRGGYYAGAGIDDSAVPYTIVPSAVSLALSAGTPTGSVSWSVRNRQNAPLTGRTLAFSSLDTSIATVNAVTGVVTRVAAGRARIKVTTDLGAANVLGVEVT